MTNETRGKEITRLTKRFGLLPGVGRGMGVDFARAALDSGHAVVATGRNPDAVAKVVGEANNLLVVRLDITSRTDAHAAVQAAVERFGRIDVLVNNVRKKQLDTAGWTCPNEACRYCGETDAGLHALEDEISCTLVGDYL